MMSKGKNAVAGYPACAPLLGRPVPGSSHPARRRTPVLRNTGSRGVPGHPALAGGLLAAALLTWPLLAQASLSSWAKEVLHLGIYRERVATLQATLSEDHSTWGLAFSPHGRYLAASSPQTAFVQLWDWRRGRVVRRFRRSGSDIESTTPLAYSPHGRLLASCQSDADTIIQVWSTRTGAVVGNIPNSGGGCAAIAFSPQGHSLIWIRELTYVASPKVRQIFVTSTRTWTIRWALATGLFQSNALTVSAHGHWAALWGGQFGWSKPRGSVKKVYSVIPQIVLVNLTTHRIERTVSMPQGTNMPGAVAWNPRARVVAVGVQGALHVGLDNVIRLYNAHTGALVGGESGPTKTWVTALRYTPHGRYLIEAGIHHEVEIWDGSHHRLLQKIPHQAWSLAVSPHGHYLALGEGGQIQVWRFR